MAGTNVLIERSSSTSGPWVPVYSGTNNGAATIAKQPTTGASFFRISGISNGVQGTPSTPVSVTPDNIPTGLSVTPNGNAKVLAWTAVAGAIGYFVYRHLSGTIKRVTPRIATAGFTDITIPAGQTAIYSVSAVLPNYAETDISDSATG